MVSESRRQGGCPKKLILPIRRWLWVQLVALGLGGMVSPHARCQDAMDLSVANQNSAAGRKVFAKPTIFEPNPLPTSLPAGLSPELRVLDWQREWGSIHINSSADGLGDPGVPVAQKGSDSLGTGNMTLCHDGGDLRDWILFGKCTATEQAAGYPSTIVRGVPNGIKALRQCTTGSLCFEGAMSSEIVSRFGFGQASAPAAWTSSDMVNFEPRQRFELVAHGIKNDIKRSVLGCMTRHLGNWPPVNNFGYSDNNTCNRALGDPDPASIESFEYPFGKKFTADANGSYAGVAKKVRQRYKDLLDPDYGPAYVLLPYWKPQGAEGWDERGALGGLHGIGCPQQIYNNCARDVHSCIHGMSSDKINYSTELAGYAPHDQKGWRHPVTHFFSYLERKDLFGQPKADEYTRSAGKNEKSGRLSLPAKYWAFQGWHQQDTCAVGGAGQCPKSTWQEVPHQAEIRDQVVSAGSMVFSRTEQCKSQLQADGRDPEEYEVNCSEPEQANQFPQCCELQGMTVQKIYEKKRRTLTSRGRPLPGNFVESRDSSPPIRVDVLNAEIEEIDTAALDFVDPVDGLTKPGPAKDLARIATYTHRLSAPDIGGVGTVTRDLIFADPSNFFDLKLYSAIRTGNGFDGNGHNTSAGAIAQSWNEYQRYGSDDKEDARYWKLSPLTNKQQLATPAECPVFGMKTGYSGICDPIPDGVPEVANGNRPHINGGCNLAVYSEEPESMQVNTLGESGEPTPYTYKKYPILWSGYVKAWTVISRDQYLANTQTRVRYQGRLYVPGQDPMTNEPLIRDHVVMLERHPDYCDNFEKSSYVELQKQNPVPDLRCVQYLQLGCLDNVASESGSCENWGLVDLYSPQFDSAPKMLASFTSMQKNHLSDDGTPSDDLVKVTGQDGQLENIKWAHYDYAWSGPGMPTDYKKFRVGTGSEAPLRQAFTRTDYYQTGASETLTYRRTSSGEVFIKTKVCPDSGPEGCVNKPARTLAQNPSSSDVGFSEFRVNGDFALAGQGGVPRDVPGNYAALIEHPDAQWGELKVNDVGLQRMFAPPLAAGPDLPIPAAALSYLRSRGVGMQINPGEGVMARVSTSDSTQAICYKLDFKVPAAAALKKSAVFVGSNSFTEFKSFTDSRITLSSGEMTSAQAELEVAKEKEFSYSQSKSLMENVEVTPCNGYYLKNDSALMASAAQVSSAVAKPKTTALAGKVSVTLDSDVVDGNGTTFQTDFKPGDPILIASNPLNNATTALRGYLVKQVISQVKLKIHAPYLNQGDQSGGNRSYYKGNNLASATRTWVGKFSAKELSQEAPVCNATRMIEARRYCYLEDQGAGPCNFCSGNSEGEVAQAFADDLYDYSLLTTALSLDPAEAAVLDPTNNAGLRGGAVMRLNPYRLYNSENPRLFANEVNRCLYRAMAFNQSGQGCPVARTTGGHIFCFGPDTRITLADGSEISIDKIRPGDTVLGFDALFSRGGQLQPVRVKAVTKTPDQRVLKINNLSVTPGHKMVLSSGRAVKAEEIRVGDKILRIDGSLEEVVSVESPRESMAVYNLVLDDGWEGYFANGLRVLSYPNLQGL